jgi:hypothetical protein
MNPHYDATLQQLERIYLLFCRPKILMNTKTGEVSVKYIWIDDDAEKVFLVLQKELYRIQLNDPSRPIS